MEILQTLSIAQNKKNTIPNQLQELTTTELMGAMKDTCKYLSNNACYYSICKEKLFTYEKYQVPATEQAVWI